MENWVHRKKEIGLVKHSNARALCLAMGAILVSAQAARAAEVLYFLSPSKDTPKEQRRILKDPEGDAVEMASEPVGKITSEQVKEARIIGEQVEVIDEDEPVNELFRVVLVLDDADNAKLAKTMDELCKTRAGVHIAFDGTVIDYRPFAVCGKFQTAVSFLDKPSAEHFAKQMSKKVTVVTPTAD